MSHNPMVLLAGRILIAALFLVAGVRKVMGFAGTIAYFGKLGFPAPEAMAVIAIIIEIGGGILLLVGLRTRLVAWLLAAFVVVASFAAHRFWEIGDAVQYGAQMTQFLKNMAIIGGLLFVASLGAGSLSADRGR